MEKERLWKRETMEKIVTDKTIVLLDFFLVIQVLTVLAQL